MSCFYLRPWFKPGTGERRLYLNGGSRKGLYLAAAPGGAIRSVSPADHKAFNADKYKEMSLERAELDQAIRCLGLVGVDFATVWAAAMCVQTAKTARRSGAIAEDVSIPDFQAAKAHFLDHGGVLELTADSDTFRVRCADGSTWDALLAPLTSHEPSGA